MDAEFIKKLFNLDLDDEELQLCEHLELEYLCPICSLVNYDIFDFSQYRSEPNIKESNVTVNIALPPATMVVGKLIPDGVNSEASVPVIAIVETDKSFVPKF